MTITAPEIASLGKYNGGHSPFPIDQALFNQSSDSHIAISSVMLLSKCFRVVKLGPFSVVPLTHWTHVADDPAVYFRLRSALGAGKMFSGYVTVGGTYAEGRRERDIG